MLDAQPRMLPRKRRQRRHHHLRAVLRRTGDAQHAAQPVVIAAHVVQHVFRLLQQLQAALVKAFAGVGQRQPPGAARQQ